MSATCHLGRWLDLEARAPDDAPYLPMLRAEIERVARAANLDPLQIKPDRRPPAAAPPSGARGPTRDQAEAMQNLTPEQRQQPARFRKSKKGAAPLRGMLEAKIKEAE